MPLLRAALKRTGDPFVSILDRLDIGEARRSAPQLLIADIDQAEVDALELLRQFRFVLPWCIIAVYTAKVGAGWALGCHLAGASCVLSQSSTETEIVDGLAHAIKNGCFTDPRFAAAS